MKAKDDEGKTALDYYLCCQQQAGLAVNHGNQTPRPRLAQNGVYLPVSDAKPLLNFLRSTLDGNSVLDTPPPILSRFTPIQVGEAGPFQLPPAVG